MGVAWRSGDDRGDGEGSREAPRNWCVTLKVPAIPPTEVECRRFSQGVGGAVVGDAALVVVVVGVVIDVRLRFEIACTSAASRTRATSATTTAPTAAIATARSLRIPNTSGRT